MLDLRHALTSAGHRPLPMRMRPDVAVHPQEFGATSSWVLKDPVSLRYFQLCDEEFEILQMLDGRTSLAQIQARFEQRFAPLQLRPEQILGFLRRLHQSGLIISDAPDQGRQLLGERNRGRRRAWLSFVANILAIRVGSVDPEPLLRWLALRLAWIFSWWCLAGCATLVVSATLLAAVEFDTLRAKLPTAAEFFTAGNLVWLAAALAIAKCVHELGHALTCKRFGGECHEIGLLLLAFVPCLYCNVSDAWLLRSKWQRIAVSAAGIVVELVLAAGCLFLWWFSQPGVFQAILLNMVVVCSVNTVLFNGNPLLRYDGYYVLSDLVGVPNLAQQSRALVQRGVRRFFLDGELAVDRSLPVSHRPLLVLYAIASFVYRWFVVAAILYVAYQVTKRQGLEVLVEVLTWTTVAAILGVPAWRALRFLHSPLERRRIRPGRVRLALVILLAVAAGLLMIPLPRRVAAPAVLQPRDARWVHVTVAGTLERSIRAGEIVQGGAELARLVNLDLDREIAELTSQRDLQRLQLDNLRARQSDDPGAGSLIPTAEAALADIEERLSERQRDAQRLVLRAPAAGTVIPPPTQPDAFYLPGSLPAWTGSPLEPRARGGYLDVGTLFCLIGEPACLEALLVIDQSDMESVRADQTVRLQVDELPGQVLRGRIIELAKTDLKIAPRELSTASEMPVHVDRQGVARPLLPSYQARVALEGPPRELLVGTRGRAKISVDSQPLGIRLVRAVRYLFRFGL